MGRREEKLRLMSEVQKGTSALEDEREPQLKNVRR